MYELCLAAHVGGSFLRLLKDPILRWFDVSQKLIFGAILVGIFNFSRLLLFRKRL